MQLVDFEPALVDSPPRLRIASGGTVDSRPLPAGTALTYGLGPRHCAGGVTDGRHESCGSSVTPRCGDHEEIWPCARCTGDCDKPDPACEESHVVYLAAFAPRTFKVGVTRDWRVQQRLQEQGAERGAVVRSVEDGRIARQIERQLATELPDRVDREAKITALAEDLDGEAWETLLAEFAVEERYHFNHDLELEHRPVHERTLWGTVQGARGRLLVIERHGEACVVDLRSLVGHDLERDAEPPPRQSSLGSFDS